MSKSKLKKHLASLSKEQIVELVLQVYDSSKQAKSFLEFYFEPNIKEELEKYKNAIYRQCYSKGDCPKNPNFRECNKIVIEFKKLFPDPEAISDLMLYYVEETTSLPAQYGDFGEAYSISLENNYIKALKFIVSEGLLKKFNKRILNLIKDSDACGYGLSDVFRQYYEECKI